MKYKRFDLDDRIKIEKLLSHKKSYSEIASALKRNKSSISREVSPFGRAKYRALRAQEFAYWNASLRKKGFSKLEANQELLEYVEEKLGLRWSQPRALIALGFSKLFLK